MKAHARHGTCTRRTVDMLGATFMAKYGKKAGEKVKEALHESKRGKSGRKVTSRKQAIAIGFSEARKAGGTVPPKKSRKH